MSATIYVLDTSYLDELGNVDGYSQHTAHDEVVKRWKAAARKGGRFFVPLPCLFELGDHVAQIKHTEKRVKCISWLRATVAGSIDNSLPWTITPTHQPSEVLPALLERFEELAGKHSIGLVDSFVETEAARLKADFRNLKARVHIWTNDRSLKRLEPDKEPDAYLWHSDGSAR